MQQIVLPHRIQPDTPPIRELTLREDQRRRMTKASSLATYSSTPLVPITMKAPSQQSRFIHTKAKNKMSVGTTPTVMKKTGASKDKSDKQKPANLLRQILSSDAGSSDSSSAPQTGTTSPQTKASIPQLKTLTFQKPSEDDIAAYDLETVKAIRSNNLDQLRQLWCSGKSMNACNQFGESVLHMACRRGYAKIVEFLLREVKVRSDRCDDFGRNPFHDALWTSVPNFDVVDLLIDYANPALLLLEDVRGNTPFAYARRDHCQQWISFLEERRDKLIKRIKADGGAVAVNEKIQVVG